MENDLSLLQQLLSLGDQISEIKQNGVRRTASATSLEVDGHEAEDEFDDRFSSSMCAITTLYVDDSQPQYFSRQNSVLRIPIPPRSSNRFGNRRLPRRPSELLRQSNSIVNGVRCLHVNSDDTESESCSSDGPQSPRGEHPSSGCSTSTSTMSYSNSSASNSSVGVKKNR
ncbi:hypothetical protein WR25_19650 [Diploscapter pachys]|uniref:Uncharacterized protein n=1 Tax=Diploscapter pachys TaxID=2018661 RepID=A0A2A2LUF4_9BILA|nr:hypothetical protein WR25_19650 [Diploscapter pachys]